MGRNMSGKGEWISLVREGLFCAERRFAIYKRGKCVANNCDKTMNKMEIFMYLG